MKLLCLFVLLMVSPAHGEVFTWTDSRGTAHYTNSLYDVPARYRAKVKVLDIGPEPRADGPASAHQTPPSAQPAQPALPVAVEQQKPRPVQTQGRPQRRRGSVADE